MLKTRVLTAIVLIALLVLALFFLPRIAWVGVAAVFLALAAWEWGGLARLAPGPRAAYAALLVAALLALEHAAQAAMTRPAYYAATAFWLVAAPIWLWRRPTFRSPGVPLAAGVVVLVPAASALIFLRDVGPTLLLAIMMAIWISDTAAFVAGRRFGRRKLAPAISPGKTWEGAFAAIAAALLYGLGSGFVYGPAVFSAPPLPASAAWTLLILVLVVAGVIGDLFESQMKRAAGVKDSGGLLPGHGGVLDRADALTAALPLAALALGLAR